MPCHVLLLGCKLAQDLGLGSKVSKPLLIVFDTLTKCPLATPTPMHHHCTSSSCPRPLLPSPTTRHRPLTPAQPHPFPCMPPSCPTTLPWLPHHEGLCLIPIQRGHPLTTPNPPLFHPAHPASHSHSASLTTPSQHSFHLVPPQVCVEKSWGVANTRH